MLDIFRTLPAVFDGIDADPAVRESLVFIVWRRVAGELLSEHTVPISLQDSRLTIAVSSNTWRAHLKELCPQMLYKLSTVLGPSVVSYIELIVDEAAVESARTPASEQIDEKAVRQRAGKALTADLRASADAIADDELRDKFLMAAGLCLARNSK